MTKPFTLGDLLKEGTELLKSAQILSPHQTAALLIREVLHVDFTLLIAHPEKQVSPSDTRSVWEALNRRATGEPLQYITGHQEFYGLDFKVTPAVLIPRPETELLVEVAVQFCREHQLSSPHVVDVGTGSGCIAIAIASQLPNARVTAIDISPEALAVAHENAARNCVLERISFLESNYLEQFRVEGSGFRVQGMKDRVQSETVFDLADVVVSNPPYIGEGEMAGLQREVRDFEPVTALLGGREGIESYATLLATAGDKLVSGGIFACEIGFTQSERVKELGLANGWECVQVTDDLQGIPRVLTFKRKTPESTGV